MILFKQFYKELICVHFQMDTKTQENGLKRYKFYDCK